MDITYYKIVNKTTKTIMQQFPPETIFMDVNIYWNQFCSLQDCKDYAVIKVTEKEVK